MDSVDTNRPALCTDIEVTSVNADVSGIGSLGIVGILAADKMPHELQVVGKEVNAMLVVVHHEEMSFAGGR